MLWTSIVAQRRSSQCLEYARLLPDLHVKDHGRYLIWTVDVQILRMVEMDKKILIVMTLVIALSACTFTISYDEGSGVVVNETREVSDFDEVAFTGIGTLNITMGDAELLEIEAEDNILPRIVTDVHGDRLEIGFDNDHWESLIRPTKPIRYFLTVRSLKEVNLSGLGDVQIEEIESDRLVLTLSGAGRVKTSGEVNELEINVTGAGSFDGADLKSERIDVNLSGAGSATVWATEFLDVNISGLGNVRYYGEPEIRETVTGLGTLENLGER